MLSAIALLNCLRFSLDDDAGGGVDQDTPDAPDAADIAVKEAEEDQVTLPTDKTDDDAAAEKRLRDQYDVQDPSDAPKGEDEDSEADEEAAPGAAKKNKDGFTPLLVQRAQKMGYTEEDISEFGTPSLLEKAVARAEAVARKSKEPDEEVADETTTDDDEPIEDDFNYALGEDVDDEIKGTFGKIGKQLSTFHRFMERELKPALAFIRKTENDTVAAEMESLFKGVDESLKGTFEIPDGTSMWDVKGEARTNIMGVLEKMAVLERAYRAEGLKVPSRKDLHGEAIRLLFPDVPKVAARKELSKELKARKGQTFARAGAKKHVESMSREQRALFNLTKAMKAKGLYAGE